MSARWLALVPIAMLAACVTTPEEAETPAEEPKVAVAPPVIKPQPPVARPAPPVQPEKAAPAPSEVEVLLADFERMRRMSPTDLAREHEAARLAFTQTRSDASRIRLAMLSTLPGAPAGEEGRALDLLEPLVKTPGATLHGLAFLLAAYIGEQRRLSAAAQGLQQNVQGLQASNQTLQQNVHALQQKLDALRTLERALSERGEASPRRR